MDGRDPERALARELKARTAARRAPAPPESLRAVARSGTSAGAPAGSRAADLGWAAVLAACLACSLILGRTDGELARALDDPSVSRAIEEAVSGSNLHALGLRLGAGQERGRGRE